MAAMTDVETPPNQRTETVSRVLAALSTGTTDGDLDREVLQVALASGGQSLLDLPEVGLWLALTEIALSESSPRTDADELVVIDLRDGAPGESPVVSMLDRDDDRSGPPTPVTARALAVVDDDVIDVESIEIEIEIVDANPIDADAEAEADAPDEPVVPPPPDPPAPAPASRVDLPAAAASPASKPTKWQLRPQRRSRRQKLPPIVAGTSTAPAVALPVPTWSARPPVSGPTAPPWPTDLATTIAELDVHLRTSLSRPIAIALADPAAMGTARVERSPVDRYAELAFAPALEAHLRSALDVPLDLRLPDGARAGTARPDPWWPPATSTAIAELDAHVRSALELPLVLALPDPATPGTAGVDLHWPRALTRQLTGLSSFLQSLLRLPTEARVPASRLAGASNGAEPDPYWPRHLVRSGAIGLPVDDLAELPAAPRSSEQLEADLQLALGAVGLVGEADLDAAAAETQISLARLVRREPLDRLGRVYPATLAAFLVHQTRLHPNPTDFEANVPISALRRTNPVGLAFSEALVRLAKPVFREVEQRDEFDHRVRYLRRMQLHAGITPDLLPAVLDAVVASHWAGARSGREVAQDWLSAHRAVSAAIGDPTFRLLTRTDHGAQMLEALLDLVRWRWVDPAPEAPPVLLDPLPSALVTAAWNWLAEHPRPAEPWGESPRPLLRLASELGNGPELELPCNSSRWHLNGELLGYGSAAHRKTVPLPTSRSGKWAITTGTARRASPVDIGVQSAADDRIVLFFDESGRFHHHVLPLGGLVATVIAPSGSRIDGQGDRTLLVDRWIGFERIEVDLAGRSEITVSERGRSAVTVPVDRRLGAHLLGAEPANATTDPTRLPRLVFRGHVPPQDELEVTVAEGATRRSSMLGDLRTDGGHDSFGFEQLVDAGTTRRVSLTVARRGCEPAVFDLVVPATPSETDVDVEPTVNPLVAPAPYVPERRFARPFSPERRRPVERSREPHLPERRRPERRRPSPPPSVAQATAPPGGGTGWIPPVPGGSPDAALRRLVRPVAVAIAGEVEATGATGLLTARGWEAAITEDLPRLVAWELRHRRPIRQWRTTAAPLQNLAPLWAADRDSERGRIVLALLAASLLSALDGPHRDLATRWTNEARLLAPHLGDCTTAFASAYAEVQRTHPASRFRPIDLA